MSFLELFKPKSSASAVPAVSVSDRWAAMEEAQANRKSRKLKISETLLALVSQKPEAKKFELKRYEPAPGVVPAAELKEVLAQDATPYQYLNGFNGFGGYTGFPGYPYLSELAQLPEYRKMVGTIADEMTRKWIKVQSTAEGDKTKRIAIIDAALRRYKVREVFRAATEHDGYFGRGQIFIEVKKPGGKLSSEDPKELSVPLFLSSKKISKDSLVGFQCIEPIWTYPSQYNSTNPLDKTFYRPHAWYVMGQTVHHSRFLTLIARPVPDILKPAYSFGGLSLSQIAQPYVDNWLRTRDSVSDIVHSFSISGLATNMEATLAGGSGEDVFRRGDLFNQARDNRSLMLLDKESEEFFQFNTPLAGLDALQAQSQEQMAAVSNIPLVKLLGIQPAGLNASSDGEIRVFYDWIHSQQEKEYREPLKKVIDIIQLSECGDIDPDIDFVFEPLYQLSALEMATANKTKAETDAVLVTGNIISAEEARTRVASDPDSDYHSLKIDTDPDNVDLDEEEEEEGDGQERADTKGTGK